MIVRSPKQTWRYVPAADRKLPRSEQTVFQLRHLTLLEEAEQYDDLDRDSSGLPIRRNLGTRRIEILRRHVIGWENLRSPEGEQVQFERNAQGLLKDELLFLFPDELRTELALAIENEIVFDPELVGKSVPPSAPATGTT